MRGLIGLLMLCFVSVALGQGHFDIWDAAVHPKEEAAVFPWLLTSRSQAVAFSQSRLPVLVRESIDDFLPIVAVKLALLNEYPSTNAATQALLARVVPSGETVTDDIRYICAMKREVQINYPVLHTQITQLASSSWGPSFTQQIYYNHRHQVSRWMSANYKRAVQVVHQMQYLEAHGMSGLASEVDFVRDSALVKLGQQIGFRFTAGNQNLRVRTSPEGTQRFWGPVRYLDCRELYDVRPGTAGTGTFNIVPQGGAVVVTIGTGTAFEVRNQVLRRFTASEVKKGVRIVPLEVPVVASHLANQTVEQSTQQTLDYSDVFTGERLTYGVTSSQTSVVQVRLGETGILVLTGIAAGNANVSLTATNASGTAVTQFRVTCTPRTE